ncbi:MAG TPA: tetratricopeptide repeat protein [Burkholderiales bacterium]|nr:tetratricopeptide repeat protein [Burkholderiales bacterium]
MARPNDLADALIAEGNRAENSGSLQEACERYRKAVAAAPGYTKAHLNLGIGLEASGDADGASRSFEAVLAIEPRNPFASYNLGNLLFKRRDLKRAEELLRDALRARPEFPEAHLALSNVLDLLGDPEAAAAELGAALEQRPDYVGALYNRGILLRKSQRLTEAEAAWRRAIEIEPHFLPAYDALGSVLRGQSRIGEALECFATARKIAPEKFDLESAELFTLSCSEETSNEALFARHKAFGERIERAIPARFRFGNVKDPQRRLRVGYLSGDFWRHPVALFALPVIEKHAEEVFCYSTGETEDEVTQALKDGADVFRDAQSMSDDALADAIHADRIDILVDLTGHSGVFRLGVLAQQPAPVQATWLGYLSTTGMRRVHYRICDGHSDPERLSDSFHTETLARLPNSQWCYRPFIEDVSIPDLPLKRNGFVTFGSFNQVAKVSSGIRRLWADILTRVPDSRLVLAGVPDGPAKDGLLADLERAGVSTARITTLPHAVLHDYLSSIGGVDIALDSTPYSGGTTTCDALWMGVPVVALQGSRSISRSAASILSTVGLVEWIASTPEDYVKLAVQFARDQVLLADLRRSLRKKMRFSPIMDEAAFVRDLENVYRAMWRAWCGGPG